MSSGNSVKSNSNISISNSIYVCVCVRVHIYIYDLLRSQESEERPILICVNSAVTFIS